ncbi:MAG TPA: di-heme oxidoredictase family protein [Bryobacteraceae bacterium]|nr:di-heme oxidoredictase family protein [Bryobacteraceae bacterium]
MRIPAYAVAIAGAAIAQMGQAQTFRPDIPKAWDDAEVARFEIPLAQRDRSPRYISAAEYYAMKVRPIYRAYPMYAPGREPAGYIESLKQKEQEIIFDPSKLRTKEDWINAGKLVFESDTAFRPAPAGGPPADALYLSSGKLGKDGELPYFLPLSRYYIRQKGVLEVGGNSCASCHTRIMPDGSFLEGAQGIVDAPFESVLKTLRDASPDALRRRAERDWALFGAPWIIGKEQFLESYTREFAVAQVTARQPGVVARQGSSPTHPPHLPSLIGVHDLRHLDATGLAHHQSIGDLMRYAIANQGLDTLAHFGDFQPSPQRTTFSGDEGTRYSDEQLYAMALYIYSLKPPANPNPPDDRARRGEKIFEQQGCGGCHTAPLYTNNKLTPAPGFQVPDDLLKNPDILNVSVGTDPTLATQTRRGTGFYKVPSLRGVWYRNAFGHGGQAETLEEWFDPARLKDDYVPKGFHIGPGPVKGHEFGLKLRADDRQALIAFLRTL